MQGQSGEYRCETSDDCKRLGKLGILSFCQGSLAVSLLCVMFRASELMVVWTTDKMEFLGHWGFFQESSFSFFHNFHCLSTPLLFLRDLIHI